MYSFPIKGHCFSKFKVWLVPLSMHSHSVVHTIRQKQVKRCCHKPWKHTCLYPTDFYFIFLEVNYDSNNMLMVKKKKTWFLASLGGGSEEVLNYILSWKYTSCHLSLDVRLFHLAWKFRLICNLFLKTYHMFDTLMCCAYFCTGSYWCWQTTAEKCSWILCTIQWPWDGIFVS